MKSDRWPIKVATIGKAEAPVRVMLTFGIHGREYLSSEIGLALIQDLCSGSPRTAKILKNTAFKILPVTNPSGRHLTDASDGEMLSLGSQDCTDRRKNFHGVDLNRNFDWHWNSGAGSSGDPLAQDYRGKKPLSEVESRILDALAGEWKPHMYIDIHTGALCM